jgi:hypothetical protein
MRPRLIIPLLIQIIYQPILIFIPPSPATSRTILIKAHSTVPATGGHEARTRGCENDEHVLLKVRPSHHRPLPQQRLSKLTEKNRHMPAHMA